MAPWPTPSPVLAVHIVQAGEPLGATAKLCQPTDTDLRALNSLPNCNLIPVGLLLVVSGDGTGSTRGGRQFRTEQEVEYAHWRKAYR